MSNAWARETLISAAQLPRCLRCTEHAPVLYFTHRLRPRRSLNTGSCRAMSDFSNLPGSNSSQFPRERALPMADCRGARPTPGCAYCVRQPAASSPADGGRALAVRRRVLCGVVHGCTPHPTPASPGKGRQCVLMASNSHFCLQRKLSCLSFDERLQESDRLGRAPDDTSALGPRAPPQCRPTSECRGQLHTHICLAHDRPRHSCCEDALSAIAACHSPLPLLTLIRAFRA